MKTNIIKISILVLTITGMVWSATAVAAQSAPQLAYGVPQILQLAQAKVSEDTIIAYIKNSGNSYSLTADQIIYLRQQGVSDAVITTMLNQPKPRVAAVTTVPVSTQPTATTETTVTSENGSTATVAPSVTYVETAPAATYYYAQPYYYPAYYGYGYYPYPAVSFSFGWGGGWGGGYHGGGYHGGGYSGGGAHGGGGFHGGGGHR